MTRIPQDTVMGLAMAVASCMLLVKEQWFLNQTQKGQALVKWFGAKTAIWVLRGILAATALLGGLLAGGIVRPIQWGNLERKRYGRESVSLAACAAFATASSSSNSAV